MWKDCGGVGGKPGSGHPYLSASKPSIPCDDMVKAKISLPCQLPLQASAAIETLVFSSVKLLMIFIGKTCLKIHGSLQRNTSILVLALAACVFKASGWRQIHDSVFVKIRRRSFFANTV